MISLLLSLLAHQKPLHILYKYYFFGRNETVLNNSPGELYTIEAIPDNCKYPLAMILAAQNQKQYP